MAATLNQSTVQDPAAESGMFQSPTIDLAYKARRHRFTKRQIRSLSRTVSLFIKNKFSRILSLRTRHRKTLDTQPLENPATTVQVERTVGEIDHEAFGPHEALGSQETAPTSDLAVQTANVTPGQFLGLTVTPTGAARTRSISAPEEITQPFESIPPVAAKEEYRRKLWEEKTRQAIERELEQSQCPCWPQCGCYLDEPRPPLDRAHTMPSRPRICISSVRDGPGNDEFYREIQELAQQAQAYRGSSDGTSQAGPSADYTLSRATTLICNPPSYRSTASTEGDSILQLRIATNPQINTDLSAEILGDEDRAHTPTPTDYVDEMLMHVGGQHDDSNNTDIDGAN